MISKIREKMRGQSAFTLIELMVVVVLVIILALALVPTFKELVTKAKYAEGVAALSAINTKLKVYQVEKSILPACITNTATYGTSERPGVLAANRTHRFVNATNSIYLLVNSDGSYSTDSTVIGVSPIQDSLDIETGDYDGKYFATTDYQVRIDNSGYLTNTYWYAVAVVGSGAIGKAPIGTGYAVMTYFNPSITDDEKTIIATFSRYKAKTGAGKMALCGGSSGGAGIEATRILAPDYTVLADMTTRAIIKKECEDKGWSMD